MTVVFLTSIIKVKYGCAAFLDNIRPIAFSLFQELLKWCHENCTKITYPATILSLDFSRDDRMSYSTILAIRLTKIEAFLDARRSNAYI
jgi:hypothetical protein